MKNKIAIGSDHAGLALKEYIVSFLKEEGFIVKDFGTNDASSCDYPDYAHPVSDAVSSELFDFGILICGSGNGVCMAANKHPYVRAALVWNEDLAALARQHNNANVLCLGARYTAPHYAKAITQTFLDSAYDGGRHEKRVKKIASF